MDVLQIPLLNQAEGDWGLRLSRPWVISHWSVTLILTNRKTKVPCSVSMKRFPEASQVRVTSWMLHFHLTLFSSPPSPLWNQDVSDLPATTTLCMGQVKLNDSSPWIPGCKCQLQVLATCPSGATVWGHIKLQQHYEPNISPVLWHWTVLASLDSYFKPWKSSDATSVWQPPTEHPFVLLLAHKNRSLGSELRLLQTGTFDLAL